MREANSDRRFSGQLLFRAVGTVGARGVALLISFALNVLLARRFGVSAAGEYYAIMGSAAIMAALLMQGADLLLVREVGYWSAGSMSSEPLRLVGGRLMTALLKRSRSVGVLLPAVALFSAYATMDGPFHSFALLAAALGLVATQMVCSLAQGLGHPGMALLVQSALLPALTIPLSLIFPLDAVVGLLIGAAALSSFVAISCARWLVKTAERASARVFAEGVQPASEADRPAALRAFFWMTLGNQIVVWAPVLVLYFLRDAASAGVFSAAVKLSSTLTLGVMICNALIARPLAAAIAMSDGAQARQLVSETRWIGIAIGVIPLLVLLLFSDAVTGIFGPAFRTGATTMRILLVGQAITCAVGPATFVLIMCRREAWIARTSLFVAGCMVPALPVALELSGSVALAWVYTGLIAMQSLVQLFLARSELSRLVTVPSRSIP